MPGQALYTPPGFLFWEKIGQSDYSGIKAIPILDAGEEENKPNHMWDTEALMSEVSKTLMMHKLNSDMAQSVVNALCKA